MATKPASNGPIFRRNTTPGNTPPGGSSPASGGSYTAKNNRLNSIISVRQYLASLIHRLEERHGGVLDAALAGRLAYISNILLGAIKDADLEKRVAELERRLKERGML